jgi:hypothetical protein
MGSSHGLSGGRMEAAKYVLYLSSCPRTASSSSSALLILILILILILLILLLILH